MALVTCPDVKKECFGPEMAPLGCAHATPHVWDEKNPCDWAACPFTLAKLKCTVDLPTKHHNR